MSFPCMNPSRPKLILIHPPQLGLMEGFSTGLVSLANYVASHHPGAEIQLLDLGLTGPADLASTIAAQLATDEARVVVGISTTTASYRSALLVARTAKQLAPRTVVVLGGHHAGPEAEAILQNHSFVDYVVAGEGERALLHLLRTLPEPFGTPGLVFRRGTEIVRNPTAAFLAPEELDQLSPTFQGWGLRSAPGKFEHVTYVSARGCPMRCSFCAVANETIRAKTIGSVIADLRHLVHDLGLRRIAIEDNFFAQSRSRTLALCAAIEELQREVPFRWDCQTRVESMQPPGVLEAMERAGCEAVYLGVEALDAESLLHLGKTRAPGRYLRSLCDEVVPRLLDSGVACYLNLQLGLPQEGPHHRTQALQLLRELGASATRRNRSITIFPQLFVIYPGTRHCQEALAEGRFGPSAEDIWERFTTWEERQQPVLEWLGQHFAHGTGGIPEGILGRDALRRGEFVIDPDAVLAIVNQLRAFSRIPGIRLFEYGRYLARPHTSTRPKHSTPPT